MKPQGREQRRHTSRREVIALLGVVLAWTAPALAQNPTDDVELYYGVQRVQPVPAKSAVQPQTAADGTAAPDTFVPMRSTNWVDPPTATPTGPPLPPQDAETPDPGIAPARYTPGAPSSGRDAPIILPPPPATDLQPLPLPSIDAQEIKPSAPAPAAEKAVQVVERARTERTEKTAEEGHGFFGTITISHVLILLAGAAWCFLAVLLSNYILLRWLGLTMKNPFRVELLAPAGWGPVMGKVTEAPATKSDPVEGAASKGEADPKRIDLGPSVEDEHAGRTTEASRKEAALLQRICDENLKLQDEISRLEAKEASPTGPVPAHAAAAVRS